jgi:response regulator RpfG family c-di-GMP phosphodiesterase
MHDIGKIAIPDAILLKEGPLTDDEREVIKTHTTLGYEMLCHSERELLRAAAVVAQQHHERWDGKGYPNSTAGEDIHVFGRITAIADVFDALSSDRVYKKAWPDEKIDNLFREERGAQFDPALIDVYFQEKERLKEIRREYRDEV